MYIYGGYVDMKGSSAELWQFRFGLFYQLRLICRLVRFYFCATEQI